jgi:hypothetical protein
MHRVFEVFLKTMSDQKRLWRLVVPIALIALVLGTTLGMVWHDHASSAPDTCPICHLSHQAIEPSVVNLRVHVLVPTCSDPEPQDVGFTKSSAFRRIPARAPPV